MSTVLTDQQTKITIAERVTGLLDERGISQSQLAVMISENKMAVSRICRGTNMPSAGMVGRIAEALKVPVDFLYGK